MINTLPPEIILEILDHLLCVKDKIDFATALAGTCHESLAVHLFIRPLLIRFAALDINLRLSLREKGWFEDVKDPSLIMEMWLKFCPFKSKKIRNVHVGTITYSVKH